jgi:hypothetical protein
MLKDFMYKLLGFVGMAITIAIIYAVYETYIKDPEDPKKTWYYADDCWQDYILYKAWKEGGEWKIEILNNINQDITLNYDISDENGNSNGYESTIKTGRTTGVMSSGIPDSDYPYIRIVSVYSRKDGVPSTMIECTEER